MKSSRVRRGVVADAGSESALRVLLLAGELEVRGSTAMTLRLAEHLGEHGFKPLIVCSSAARLSAETRREVEIREYPGLSTRVIGQLIRRLLARDFRDLPPILVHVQSRRLASLGGWLASNWSRPLVVSVNEVVADREPLRMPRALSRVLAVSEAVREALVDRGSMEADRAEVIPAGVDAPQVERLVGVLESDHVPSIGTAGPLEAVKGVPYFLGAAQKVLATGRDVEFLVAGSGPEESNLRRLAGELGIRGRVTFLPNRPDFSDALAAVDAFCLPSLQQGLGTIMLEAMSLGRPVIASAVGGVCSAVRDGETGLVVPPGDSTALARGVLSLLDDPVRARAIGEAGRAEVMARFGTDAMVKRTVAVYNEVIEQAGMTPAAVEQSRENGTG